MTQLVQADKSLQIRASSAGIAVLLELHAYVRISFRSSFSDANKSSTSVFCVSSLEFRFRASL